jgi:nucleotide-binding universal stress UspA family protein
MLPVKRILCPVDFSEPSRAAFERAIGIGRQRRAEVIALHVWPPYPDVAPSQPASQTGTGAAQEMGRREVMTRELERFLDVPRPGVMVACDVCEAPDPGWEIAAHADRLSVDLIVMGTHGRRGFRRLLFGSVAEKVLRLAHAPVLTIPTSVLQAVPVGGAPFRRILCAIDFSECSLAALRRAVALAEHPDVRLTALHVVELLVPPYNPVMGPPVDLAGFQLMFERAGRSQLQHAITEAMRQACHIEEMIATGKPHLEIVRVAQEQQSDLIVLGIHGRGPIERLMFGSTAEAVVRRATCPVLTVRPENELGVAAA